MKAHEKMVRIRAEKELAAQKDIDPEALWLNPEVSGEDLVEQDPLDAWEVEAQAESPELGDFNLQSLPRQPWSEKLAQHFWRAAIRRFLEERGEKAENGVAFLVRIRDSS